MYDYLFGKIIELNPSYLVIDVNHIGYFVHISLTTYSQLKPEVETKLFVHQIVREDANILYGFSSKKERETFNHLIGVSGVGANTARMILSSLSPIEFETAIVGGKVDMLKNVKGIGLKTAQRLILELKDKVGTASGNSDFLPSLSNTTKEESLSALLMLGFQKAAAEKVIEKILLQNKNFSVEEVVKNALKQL